MTPQPHYKLKKPENAMQRTIRLESTISDLPDLQLDPFHLRHVAIIAKGTVNNVIKRMPNTQITDIKINPGKFRTIILTIDCPVWVTNDELLRALSPHFDSRIKISVS
jgi:hypothetical protein